MNCKECGASFTPYKAEQLFCSAAHRNKYHQRTHRRRHKASDEHMAKAASQTDDLQSELERLKEQNDSLKDSLKRHHDILDEKDKEIDLWKDLVRIREKEIERLKFDAQFSNKEITEVRRLTTILVTNNIHKQYDEHIKRTFREYSPASLEAIRTFGTRFFHDVIRAV